MENNMAVCQEMEFSEGKNMYKGRRGGQISNFEGGMREFQRTFGFWKTLGRDGGERVRKGRRRL